MAKADMDPLNEDRALNQRQQRLGRWHTRAPTEGATVGKSESVPRSRGI